LVLRDALRRRYAAEIQTVLPVRHIALAEPELAAVQADALGRPLKESWRQIIDGYPLTAVRQSGDHADWQIRARRRNRSWRISISPSGSGVAMTRPE
jgi:hypothetical protein